VEPCGNILLLAMHRASPVYRLVRLFIAVNYVYKLIKYEFITVYIRSHCWTELFRLSVQIAVKVGHLLLLQTCIYCFM